MTTPDPAAASAAPPAQTCDVLVIGSGAAGAAAALAAHEAGAHVIVVDKAPAARAGGNTRLSGGGWFVHDDPAAAATFLRALCADRAVDDVVVTAWARETAANTAWLRGLGAPVERSADYHPQAEYAELPGADCYLGMDTLGGMGEGLMHRFLTGALSDRGIEVRYDSQATELLRDDGAVTGALVGGEPIHARGGTVLATGGFAADPAMVADHLGIAGQVLWGSPDSTGDGHRMAAAAGADFWHMTNHMAITGIDMGRDTGMYLALWGAPNHLFVGADGRWFIDESAPPRHGHTRREGRDVLFPTHGFHLIGDAAMLRSGPLSPPRQVLPVGYEVLMRGSVWSADNRAEVDAGLIAEEPTIAALATRIGVEPEVLERTVARYNDYCAAGRDDGFGRPAARLGAIEEGPFFALPVTPLLGWTNGGPRRDEHARVCAVSGAPIPGLYAAGEASSTYSWRKDGGFHIADALAFGRIAGRIAGRHAAARA